MDTHDNTIRELESAASDHSDRLGDLESLARTLATQVSQLKTKCKDLKGCSRRNNIRLVGVPEDVEGPNPTEFVSGLLQTILNLDQKPVLDRAHHGFRQKSKGDPPRPLIIRLHY